MSERDQPIDVTGFRATVEAAIEAAFRERAVGRMTRALDDALGLS